MESGTSRKRILFLSPSEALTAPAVSVLEAAGHSVVPVANASAGQTWLRVNRADLAIVDLGSPTTDHVEENSQLVGRIQDGEWGASTALLVLARARSHDQLRSLFERQRLMNFLAIGQGETLDVVEFGVTVSKILGRSIFGIDLYLAPDAHQRTVQITSSRQKSEVVEMTAEFARQAGCHPRMAQDLAVAVDELVTNAVYNAPVDAEGRSRYGSRPRNVPVDLEPGEEVTVSLARDNRRICISARDSFGSLQPQVVLGYLVKCFAGGENQVDQKEGGAGLGLYYLFNLLNSFVVNIAPGKATESIGIVEIAKSYKSYTSRWKSFNIFLESDQRS